MAGDQKDVHQTDQREGERPDLEGVAAAEGVDGVGWTLEGDRGTVGFEHGCLLGERRFGGDALGLGFGFGETAERKWRDGNEQAEAEQPHRKLDAVEPSDQAQQLPGSCETVMHQDGIRIDPFGAVPPSSMA